MKGFASLLVVLLLMVATPSACWPSPIPGNLAGGDGATERDSVGTAPGGPTITPVDIDDDKAPVILHYYDRHGDPLPAPVLVLEEDTVAKASPKPVYPKYNGLDFGLDFGDALFMAFGRKTGGVGLWADVSLWNWIFPVVECGIGWANDRPSGQNYTYRTRPSVYAKAGLNYNFLYKSKPDHRLYFGLRAGWSTFRYDLRDVSIESQYWDESQRFSMEGLKSTAFWGEALVGLQVKIAGCFSLGWRAGWKFPFHIKADKGSKPWYIPGYGSGSGLIFNVSGIVTI